MWINSLNSRAVTMVSGEGTVAWMRMTLGDIDKVLWDRPRYKGIDNPI